MGNKLSVTSTYLSPSSSHDKTRVPKYLKNTKSLKKQQRERLQQQQQRQQQQQQKQKQKQNAVAIPYQPHTPIKSTSTDTDESSSSPPFAFIGNGSQNFMEMQEQQQQRKLQQQQDVSVIDHDGPRNAFHWFEGRRYRYQDDSILPNDERELDRLRVLNYILRWALEGDVVAPVKTKLLEGTHVLNVGCGPGIWLGHPVIDFALDYPRSHFTAVDVLDLLPEQDIYPTRDRTTMDQTYTDFSPRHPMLPTGISSSTWHQQSAVDSPTTTTNENASNLTSYSTSSSTTTTTITPPSSYPPLPRSIFEHLDIYALDIREHGLPFSDDTFEFVMQRWTSSVYSVQQWQDVIRELIRVTQPGGYIQLIEPQYYANGLGPFGQKWQNTCAKMLYKTRNLDPFMGTRLDKLLLENGLVNVEKKTVSIPFGSWGLDIGILWQQNLEAFVEASAPAFGAAFGISGAEFFESWQQYKEELNTVKAFGNVYAVWGQKPE